MFFVTQKSIAPNIITINITIASLFVNRSRRIKETKHANLKRIVNKDVIGLDDFLIMLTTEISS